MKKGELYTGFIERTDFPNKGISTAPDGTHVVIKNALPGQTVTARIQKGHSKSYEGRLISVDKHADCELQGQDACCHDGVCGGCLYQRFPYEEQLRIKREQVKRLIDAAYPEEYTFGEAYPSPLHDGYRNKMEYSFGDEIKDGPLCLGLHKRNSNYDIVNAEACRIADRDFGTLLRIVLKFYSARGIPYYKKMQHTGILRHLLIRKSAFTGQILAVLVTASGKMDWEKLRAYLEIELLTEKIKSARLDGKLAGFMHMTNDSMADVVSCDEEHLLYGKPFITEKLMGLSFDITPFSFFQTNSAGAEVLYGVVRDYIGDTTGKLVYDLYCGTGTIAQIAAPVAKHVVGVEIVEEAVEAAERNAKANHLENCEFIAGDVLDVLGGLTQKPDICILDPPRDGIHPRALPKITAYAAPYLVYVSCKPTSLARDLTGLYAAGYRIRKICCVDMFPNTSGIETVCLLAL